VRKTTSPKEAIRLLRPPSLDRLNAHSPTPPLEMAGPPLRLSSLAAACVPAAFPSSVGELRTARLQQPYQRGRVAEPLEPPWGGVASSNLQPCLGVPSCRRSVAQAACHRPQRSLESTAAGRTRETRLKIKLQTFAKTPLKNQTNPI
jgi:hypothetical protein